MFVSRLKKVIGGDSLSLNEAYESACLLLHGEVPTAQAAAFLAVLRARKETGTELSGFVQALYQEAVMVDTGLEVLDTCGTGGDGMGTFNISTAASLVVAACGIPVAKHGNRAVTGKVGSADVLEAMGVNIQLSPDESRHMLDEVGITFLFAPNYHPILKQVGGLRREMGVMSIFNFLGPLLNPFKPSFQVMGIADPALLESVAQTSISTGRERVLVVHADNGMDEISPVGPTRIHDANTKEISEYSFDPSSVGISPFPLDLINGGDADTNAAIIKNVLSGRRGPHRDAVVLNTAAALLAGGKAHDFNTGMLLAGEAIDTGRALKKLHQMIDFSRDGVKVC